MAEAKNPPYGTYGMLKATVERFVDAVVPTSLNRHVLSDLSGGDYNALGATLRFFGFIDESRAVQQPFRDLVEAKKKGDQHYKDLLQSQIERAYKSIVADVDVTRGTLPELERKFRDAGVPQGDMLTKTIRFYIKALEDCGVKVSEHITKPRPRSPRSKAAKGTATKAKSKGEDSGKGGAGSGEMLNEPDAIPPGVERLTMPGDQNAYIQYPSELTAKHFKMFEAMLTVLKTYVSLDETEEDKKP